MRKPQGEGRMSIAFCETLSPMDLLKQKECIRSIERMYCLLSSIHWKQEENFEAGAKPL